MAGNGPSLAGMLSKGLVCLGVMGNSASPMCMELCAGFRRLIGESSNPSGAGSCNVACVRSFPVLRFRGGEGAGVAVRRGSDSGQCTAFGLKRAPRITSVGGKIAPSSRRRGRGLTVSYYGSFEKRRF